MFVFRQIFEKNKHLLKQKRVKQFTKKMFLCKIRL
ncbi:hypothetical protein H702_06295 [Streptococcus equinus JB1]|uniref:Uncharacterized protein n=1 Tax=Streptococcus equinus JB1 TaxID=1294274 RepID=A0A091BVC8_STREI|nr:hypothetical protein H702_06295 [Streptococcus equinus JB1]